MNGKRLGRCLLVAGLRLEPPPRLLVESDLDDFAARRRAEAAQQRVALAPRRERPLGVLGEPPREPGQQLGERRLEVVPLAPQAGRPERLSAR